MSMYLDDQSFSKLALVWRLTNLFFFSLIQPSSRKMGAGMRYSVTFLLEPNVKWKTCRGMD